MVIIHFVNALAVRPRVAELVFQVYGRPLHPELFDVLAWRKVQHEDYEVNVRITRTGHVVTFENGDVLLTELADIDQRFSEKRRLVHFRMRGEHAYTLPTAHGITYQTSFQVETVAPEVFAHIHDEILRDGARTGLLHNFCPHHRLAIAPLGYMTVEAKPGCLFISAFHTFPEECTLVKSQTLIESPRGRRSV